MSKWTHPLCPRCYAAEEFERQPVRLKNADTERCCRCDIITWSGIYYRKDPAAYGCQGRHEG